MKKIMLVGLLLLSLAAHAQFEGPSQICSLAGPGMYNGIHWQWRVAIDGYIVSGAPSGEDALFTISHHRRLGECNADPSGPCIVVEPGFFFGDNYNYRIAIGDTLVYGTNDEQDMIETVHRFQSESVCY